MQLDLKPATHRMLTQTAEWGSIPRALVVENIINNHFLNIKRKKVVLTLEDELWKKLMLLSAKRGLNREDVIRHAIEELHLDSYPKAEEEYTANAG